MTTKTKGNDEINIILNIPANTAFLTVGATVIDESGKLVQYKEMTLMPEAIRQARQDFLDNVPSGDDYNAEYALTEKGLELLGDETNDEKQTRADE